MRFKIFWWYQDGGRKYRGQDVIELDQEPTDVEIDNMINAELCSTDIKTKFPNLMVRYTNCNFPEDYGIRKIEKVVPK